MTASDVDVRGAIGLCEDPPTLECATRLDRVLALSFMVDYCSVARNSTCW